jgi:hypothetical protein
MNDSKNVTTLPESVNAAAITALKMRVEELEIQNDALWVLLNATRTAFCEAQNQIDGLC